METNDSLAQILSRLNEWTSERNLHFTETNVLFVRDDAVNYSAESVCVQQQHLVTAEQFQQAFGPMLAGGPSWIHANVIPLGGQRFIVTLIAGQKIGSPKPSINVSYEPEKTAEILSAKTLVTAH